MRMCFYMLSLIAVMLSGVEACFSQEKAGGNDCNCPGGGKGKGTLYISWGYSRDWFSRTDIHIYGNATDPATKGSLPVDFTLHNVKAQDRPDFDKIYYAITRGDLAIPQYNYRIGYYFPKKHNMGIEINFDHVKYVMEKNQTLHLTGSIGETNYDMDTLVTPEKFLHFEHTNGANFLMVNFLYSKNIFVSKNKKHWVNLVAKPGTGVVIPKTYVVLFGEELDNRFHIAGFVTGVETGLRYDHKHFFIEPTVKGTFADYMNVLVLPGVKASHSFFTLEAILTAGFQFGL